MAEATNHRILNGWKQISHHLDRGVRTAQRWEVLLGMPVHRPALKDRSAVVAFSDELESWLSRTLPDVRNECVQTTGQATNINEWNESLLRALDNMSTLVRQSCDLLSQVQMLQGELRRSRKSRPPASRSLASRSLAPRSLASRSLASRSLAPTSLASRSLAPRSLAPRPRVHGASAPRCRVGAVLPFHRRKHGSPITGMVHGRGVR